MNSFRTSRSGYCNVNDKGEATVHTFVFKIPTVPMGYALTLVCKYHPHKRLAVIWKTSNWRRWRHDRYSEWQRWWKIRSLFTGCTRNQHQRKQVFQHKLHSLVNMYLDYISLVNAMAKATSELACSNEHYFRLPLLPSSTCAFTWDLLKFFLTRKPNTIRRWNSHPSTSLTKSQKVLEAHGCKSWVTNLTYNF